MSSNSKPPTPPQADWFLATRRKGSSTSGTITFIALRTLDVALQYYLLRSNAAGKAIAYLGGMPIPPAARAILSSSGSSSGFGSSFGSGSTSGITPLGLPPYETLIFLMSLGAAAKQIFWKAYIGETIFPAGFATMVAIYNTVLNTLNLFLSQWGPSSNYPSLYASPSSASPLFLSRTSALTWTDPGTLTRSLGAVLVVLGLGVETVCEVQRKWFKDDPRNEGKPYAGGLFGLATNINYGGYTLWRTGYALVCAGLPWGVVMAGWLAADFCGRAIPSMERYCEGRYGAERWGEVRRRVRWRLLPGIY
ncbi:hypothetical protein MMC19_001276 [Ptychographa xylographoides]|nr:hypothetical protein [Ptychographa xylographoides]